MKYRVTHHKWSCDGISMTIVYWSVPVHSSVCVCMCVCVHVFFIDILTLTYCYSVNCVIRVTFMYVYFLCEMFIATLD